MLERKPVKVCLLGLENAIVFMPGLDGFRVGGEQVQQSLIARGLSHRGYQASMVCMDYGQPDEAEVDGVRVYKAYAPNAGLPVLRFIYPRWIKMWSALRHADADIYYTSCAGMQVGLLALFCQRHKRKFIYRVAHDNDCNPSSLLIALARDKHLYEYGLRHAHGILTQSQQQTEALELNYRLSSQVAGMLVEKPSHSMPYHEQDIDVLWVNNIRKFKRPDLVLDLAESMPEASFHLVGGPNDPELYEQIKRRADSLQNVTFHGPVPYRQVGGFYDRCRVFLNTSDIEGFPNSYLQAWVRSRPVVAFFDPDALIKREGMGQAVKSIDEMRRAVRSYLSNRSALEDVGERCREYMSKKYDDDVVLQPYMQMIKRLVSPKAEF
jgi:glycosyltransferase involved in cell wall biosynthesis